MNKQKQWRLAAMRQMEDDRQQPCESAEDAYFAERFVGNARDSQLFSSFFFFLVRSKSHLVPGFFFIFFLLAVASSSEKF